MTATVARLDQPTWPALELEAAVWLPTVRGPDVTHDVALRDTQPIPKVPTGFWAPDPDLPRVSQEARVTAWARKRFNVAVLLACAARHHQHRDHGDRTRRRRAAFGCLAVGLASLAAGGYSQVPGFVIYLTGGPP